MVTRAEVIEGYRVHLRREPESEAVIRGHMRAHPGDTFIAALLESPEYRALNPETHDGIRFFHSFERDGLSIRGHRPIADLQVHAEQVFLQPVAGKSVLDIGAWDGFFSFEAERRGARRVLATDHFCWSGPGWGTKAGFDYVHGRLESSVESLDVDVFDLDPVKLGTFDMTFFFGVLYHLKDPFGGLEKAAAMTSETLIVETHIDMDDQPEPVMRYYLGAELNTDATNFWGPNTACVEAMLRELGFTRFSHWKSRPGKKTGRLITRARR